MHFTLIISCFILYVIYCILYIIYYILTCLPCCLGCPHSSCVHIHHDFPTMYLRLQDQRGIRAWGDEPWDGAMMGCGGKIYGSRMGNLG